MKRYIDVHLFSYKLLDLFKIYSLQSCEKWGKQRLRQLTCDSLKYLTTLANLFFHFSSLFFYLDGFLQSGGKKIPDCLTRRKSFTSTVGSNYLCSTCEWESPLWLVESPLLGTQNRKRDKTHIAWFSNYLNSTTVTF